LATGAVVSPTNNLPKKIKMPKSGSRSPAINKYFNSRYSKEGNRSLETTPERQSFEFEDYGSVEKSGACLLTKGKQPASLWNLCVQFNDNKAEQRF